MVLRRKEKCLETSHVKWNFVMSVNCDCNKNIWEAITITFPGKQTIMKHDMNKFNLTQFECRIQNLINLLVNRKKLNVFFLPLSFQISQINHATTSVWFFNDVSVLFLWTAILSIYLLPVNIWKEWHVHWQFDMLQANPATD